MIACGNVTLIPSFLLILVGILPMAQGAETKLKTASRVCEGKSVPDAPKCDGSFVVGPANSSGLPVGDGQVGLVTEIEQSAGVVVIHHIWYQAGVRRADVPIRISVPKFRTFSRKRLFGPRSIGDWKVDVANEKGEVLESFNFIVEAADGGLLRVTHRGASVPIVWEPAAAKQKGVEPAPVVQVEQNADPASPSRFSIQPEVGIESASYQARFVQPSSQIALQGRLTAGYELPIERLSVSSSFHSTLVPFKSSGDNAPMYFIGGDLLGDYELPFLGGPWRWDVSGGGFFETSSASSGRYEFQSMFGPKLLTSLRRILTSQDAVKASAAISLITSGSVIDLSLNRGYTFGLSWERGLLEVGAAYTNLQYQDVDSAMILDSFTLSAGYRF